MIIADNAGGLNVPCAVVSTFIVNGEAAAARLYGGKHVFSLRVRLGLCKTWIAPHAHAYDAALHGSDCNAGHSNTFGCSYVSLKMHRQQIPEHSRKCGLWTAILKAASSANRAASPRCKRILIRLSFMCYATHKLTNLDATKSVKPQNQMRRGM